MKKNLNRLAIFLILSTTLLSASSQAGSYANLEPINQNFQQSIVSKSHGFKTKIKTTQAKTETIAHSHNLSKEELIHKMIKALLLSLSLFFVLIAILLKFKKKITKVPPILQNQSPVITEQVYDEEPEEISKDAHKNTEKMKSIIFNFFDLNK